MEAVMYGSSGASLSSSDSSITGLLGALCDAHLCGVSWKQCTRGGRTQEGTRRALRRCAFGALLSRLFQDPSHHGPAQSQPATLTPSRNKVLMLSFELRVSGCQMEAERLEQLLWQLPEDGGAVDSMLELLVQLAGSVPPPPPSYDFLRRKREVQRRPPIQGYEGGELRRLEAQAWTLVCGEEWGALASLGGTLGLMEASPGTGLLALGHGGGEAEERYERETRLSLFGALQHTRTADMDIRLELPPVPSNIDITGLAIRVPTSLDQSEDEGFQSSSNLTPDSQSEPSPSPELDVWEALRGFEPGHRRCWERVGCPPGRKEPPYLSEGGREVFDQLYRLWEGDLRLLTTAPIPPLPPHSQTQLVTDLLNVLIGVASSTFPLNQTGLQFGVRGGVCVSGVSPESVARLLGELAEYGTHYLRLSRFALHSPQGRGLVLQAFTGGLRRYLHYYRACVLCTPPTLSLLTISFLFRKVGRQLRYLSELCCVDVEAGGSQTGAGRGCVTSFPVGVKLLSYLYNEAQSNCSNENYPVLLSLLKSSCEPYTRFIYDWVYSGVFRDVYGEFMIQVNEEYLSCRDKQFWTQGYTLISRNVEECVPVFLRHIANDVYVCGKTINLLKICCPRHYICWSELPVPRVAVTFSQQELEEIERDCSVYHGRMERIAHHCAISREEKLLRTEQARQELINQIRESAARTLENIRGHQVSQRLAKEAKKRERFEELKQQMAKEQEWRSASRQREQEDDFGFARELRDRERRLRALEEQLERKARKDLLEQYSRLSEEAALRERRALWRGQRLQLDPARALFLEQDHQHIQAFLKQFPLGQKRPPPDLLLPRVEPLTLARAQCTEQSAQEPAWPGQCGQECPPESEERLPGCDQLDDPSSSLSPQDEGPLISEDLDINDFLPKRTPGPVNCPSQVQSMLDTALLEIGSDLLEDSPAQNQNHDYDFSTPYSPLKSVTKESRARPSGASPDRTALPLDQGETLKQPALAQPRANVHGHSSQAIIQVAVRPLLPCPSAHGHPSQASLQLGGEDEVGQGGSTKTDSRGQLELVDKIPTLEPAAERAGETADKSSKKTRTTAVSSDPGGGVEVGRGTSQGQLGLYGKEEDKGEEEHPSELQCLMPSPGQRPTGNAGSRGAFAQLPQHPSDSSVMLGGCVSEGHGSPLKLSPHGHASNAHIKVGGFVSEQDPERPVASVHRHISDAHIRVGGNVSEVDDHLHTASIHGHCSDSSIKVGGFMSKVEQSRPRWSKHGHSSDASIKVGGFVSGPEPTRPTASMHGHSSDSSIRVGGFVSDVPPLQPRWSMHGHASDTSLGVGCMVLDSEQLLLPHAQPHSHVSDSSFGEGLSLQHAPSTPLPRWSIHGHASQSHFRHGKLVSTLQHPQLLGQLTEESGETEDEPQGPVGKVEAETHSKDGLSWAEGDVGSPGWSTEQSYLLSLAAQYEVEQYQDNYSLLTAPPGLQLLQQVTCGPYGFPVDPSLRRATDATAVQLSELVSLPVLMKHSVTTPLITQVSLVNKAIVDYFFVELGLERHFEALRHFLLMEDGEFAQSLSDLLFEKVRE
ncbi:GCP6 protein, partial [Amia calva]|nr:GCP6 protein [Amia calva]